jgi:hypothetical protein
MFAGETLVSRSELSMVIAIWGVLFLLAFTSLGHLAWSVPAMTLFCATGAAFLYALFSGPSERLLVG